LVCVFVAKSLTISLSAESKETVRRRRKLDDAVIQGSLESPQVTGVPFRPALCVNICKLNWLVFQMGILPG
jgi:hypothetical protein